MVREQQIYARANYGGKIELMKNFKIYQHRISQKECDLINKTHNHHITEKTKNEDELILTQDYNDKKNDYEIRRKAVIKSWKNGWHIHRGNCRAKDIADMYEKMENEDHSKSEYIDDIAEIYALRMGDIIVDEQEDKWYMINQHRFELFDKAILG